MAGSTVSCKTERPREPVPGRGGEERMFRRSAGQVKCHVGFLSEKKEMLLFLKKKKQKDFYFFAASPACPVFRPGRVLICYVGRPPLQ
jgi:hypothetical protein